MKKAIIGAGGFAREVKSYIDEPVKLFVDDIYWEENDDDILPISEFNVNMYSIVIAIGDPVSRRKIVEKLPKETKYFTYIHPSCIIGQDVIIEEGCIICPGCIITTNIKIGKHAHLNLQTTIGHDCVIGDYLTTAPGSKISGNCEIGDMVYLGTNCSIKQKIKICNNTTIGLNCGVVKNIDESGTYVGTPAKKI